MAHHFLCVWGGGLHIWTSSLGATQMFRPSQQAHRGPWTASPGILYSIFHKGLQLKNSEITIFHIHIPYIFLSLRGENWWKAGGHLLVVNGTTPHLCFELLEAPWSPVVQCVVGGILGIKTPGVTCLVKGGPSENAACSGVPTEPQIHSSYYDRNLYVGPLCSATDCYNGQLMIPCLDRTCHSGATKSAGFGRV